METASSASNSLAEALFGKTTRTDEVWSEVRFDSPASYLECLRGEVVLEMLVSDLLLLCKEAAVPRAAVGIKSRLGTLPLSATVLVFLSNISNGCASLLEQHWASAMLGKLLTASKRQSQLLTDQTMHCL
jgi:hypothetical protein